jgi:hypothetical protein
LNSAKHRGGGKRKLQGSDRTPPPQPRWDSRLMIASNMTFLPGPWNYLAFQK